MAEYETDPNPGGLTDEDLELLESGLLFADASTLKVVSPAPIRPHQWVKPDTPASVLMMH